TDACACRNIRDRGNFEPLLDVKHCERLAQNRMLNRVSCRGQLGLCILQVEVFWVEIWMDNDKGVFRDRSCKHRPAMLPIKIRHIGTTADQADPEWRTGYDHAPELIIWIS